MTISDSMATHPIPRDVQTKERQSCLKKRATRPTKVTAMRMNWSTRWLERKRTICPKRCMKDYRCFQQELAQMAILERVEIIKRTIEKHTWKI